MNKLIFAAIIFFGTMLSSSYAFADYMLLLEGKGTTADAVKSFNKSVAANDGVVERNAETEYSSAGMFGLYQAKMFSEEKEGVVAVRIIVKLKEADLVSFLTVQSSTELKIITKIKESMLKAGYKDSTPYPDQKK